MLLLLLANCVLVIMQACATSITQCYCPVPDLWIATSAVGHICMSRKHMLFVIEMRQNVIFHLACNFSFNSVHATIEVFLATFSEVSCTRIIMYILMQNKNL